MVIDGKVIRQKIPHIQVSYSVNIPHKNRYKIQSSQAAYTAFMAFWDESIIELLEEFKMFLLNRSNYVLGIYHVTQGGTSRCVIDKRHILSVALKCNAHGLIFAHNHPSGKPIPSQDDIMLTQNMKEACNIVGITLLDHLVLTPETYYSFADEGCL